MSDDDGYSEVADNQLDALEAGDDIELYNAVIDACDLVFRLTGEAHRRSTAIQTADGIVFRLPVTGHSPYKVFWTSRGTPPLPRVEAVFPHP